MARPRNEDSRNGAEAPAAPPGRGTSLGGTLVAVGALLIVGAVITESYGWMLYLGIGLAVGGAGVWTVAGVSWRQELEWVKSGAVALALALMFRWGVAEPYKIPSASMEPTLIGHEGFLRGDRVWVNKWVYGLRMPFRNARINAGAEPARWDIVVFKSVEPNARYGTLVKRVVGLPGERIHIAGGKVFADGTPLALPPAMAGVRYTSPSSPYSDLKFGVLEDDAHALVPPGHYLVLGDNSPNSRDGRVFGWLPEEHIVGRVSCVWWPIGHLRDFTGFSKTLWWRGAVGLLALYAALRIAAGRSYPHLRADGRVDRLLVSFLHLGLRVPMTRWWLVRWGAPARGALVVYRAQPKGYAEPLLLAGRIAGLPGDRVAIDHGRLLVNGATPAEPALARLALAQQPPEAAFGLPGKKSANTAPDRHYFIVADGADAPDAIDSRTLGFVPEGQVAGLAVGVWWPPARAGKIE